MGRMLEDPLAGVRPVEQLQLEAPVALRAHRCEQLVHHHRRKDDRGQGRLALGRCLDRQARAVDGQKRQEAVGMAAVLDQGDRCRQRRLPAADGAQHRFAPSGLAADIQAQGRPVARQRFDAGDDEQILARRPAEAAQGEAGALLGPLPAQEGGQFTATHALQHAQAAHAAHALHDVLLGHEGAELGRLECAAHVMQAGGGPQAEQRAFEGVFDQVPRLGGGAQEVALRLFLDLLVKLTGHGQAQHQAGHHGQQRVGKGVVQARGQAEHGRSGTSTRCTGRIGRAPAANSGMVLRRLSKAASRRHRRN